METIVLKCNDIILDGKTFSFTDENQEPITIGQYNKRTFLGSYELNNVSYAEEGYAFVDDNKVSLLDIPDNKSTFSIVLSTTDELRIKSAKIQFFNGINLDVAPVNVYVKVSEVGKSETWQENTLKLSVDKDKRKEHIWNVAVSLSPKKSGDISNIAMYLSAEFY